MTVEPQEGTHERQRGKCYDTAKRISHTHVLRQKQRDRSTSDRICDETTPIQIVDFTLICTMSGRLSGLKISGADSAAPVIRADPNATRPRAENRMAVRVLKS